MRALKTSETIFASAALLQNVLRTCRTVIYEYMRPRERVMLDEALGCLFPIMQSKNSLGIPNRLTDFSYALASYEYELMR